MNQNVVVGCLLFQVEGMKTNEAVVLDVAVLRFCVSNFTILSIE
jgi:hypothetical protein